MTVFQYAFQINEQYPKKRKYIEIKTEEISTDQNKKIKNEIYIEKSPYHSTRMDEIDEKSIIKLRYHLNIPWYLIYEYRNKYKLSIRDIRHMLLSTPIPCLLNLSISLGQNITDIIGPEYMTDQAWISFQNWNQQINYFSSNKINDVHHGCDIPDIPFQLHSEFYKDDTRLQTILVNQILQFFVFETQQFEPEIQESCKIDKCICPFDTHQPLLPVIVSDRYLNLLKFCNLHEIRYFLNNFDIIGEDDIINMSPPISISEEEAWICRGGYNGYQKWQNRSVSHQYVLIQTPKGHEFLQKFESASKKRKEIYLKKWNDSIYLENDDSCGNDHSNISLENITKISDNNKTNQMNKNRKKPKNRISKPTEKPDSNFNPKINSEISSQKVSTKQSKNTLSFNDDIKQTTALNSIGNRTRNKTNKRSFILRSRRKDGIVGKRKE